MFQLNNCSFLYLFLSFCFCYIVSFNIFFLIFFKYSKGGGVATPKIPLCIHQWVEFQNLSTAQKKGQYNAAFKIDVASIENYHPSKTIINLGLASIDMQWFF